MRGGLARAGLRGHLTGMAVTGPKILPACFLSLVASFLLFFPRPLLPAEGGQYRILEIKPQVFVAVADDILGQEGDTSFLRAANAGFIITPQGVVVIDTTNTPFNARSMLYEIRRRTDLPVRFVIDTGASPDAMLGNEAFVDFEPTILATSTAATLIRRYESELPGRMEASWMLKVSMRGIHPTPPGETFDGTLALPIPNPQIKLISLGDNDSPGEAVVYLPQLKVLFLGDLFENGYIPQMDSGNIQNWIATLRKVESWDVDIFVPRHGPPGGRQQVEQFRRFLEWLLSQVQSRVRQGKTEQQIENELVPFPGYAWRAPELESKALAAVYRQLTASGKEASASPKTPTP
jgi:cyclase